MKNENTFCQTQRKLLTRQGFIDRYYEMCSYMCPIEAYEATERQLEAITGARRYKNYESFKTVKNKFMRSVKIGNKVSAKNR